MTEHSEDAGTKIMESARRRDRREKSRDRRSPEPDRRKDRRESSGGRHLSRAMSCHPAEAIQARGVMASRHYLSHMPPDRSHIMDESRKLIGDRRQSPRTTNRKGASMQAISGQTTKDEIKRAQKHKLYSASEIEERSRQKRSKPEVPIEPEPSSKTESSQRTVMPPRTRRSAQPEASPPKMGKKVKATNDQSLRGRLSRILSAKSEEFGWDGQKKQFREWAARVKKDGRDQAGPIVHAGLATYLGAPQIARFGNLKDLAAKYIVSRFHDGKFWLDSTVKLTAELVHRVTGLPITGSPVPLAMPTAELIRQYFRSEAEGTNSKGLRIVQTTDPGVQWALVIIALCLTNAGRTSSVKRDVLPVAVEVATNGTVYNWCDYLVGLLTENITNCQETGASIRFPSLIIWLAMTDVTPVGDPQFTAIGQPFMFNFRRFSMTSTQDPQVAEKYFENWFQNLKLKCGKWRVPQVIRRSLPANVQVDLQLDHTKIWSGAEGTLDAEDLEYIPTVAALYAELSRQVGSTVQPPEEAFIQTDFVAEPLTEGEEEEAREMAMYVEMFSWAEPESTRAAGAAASMGETPSTGQLTQTNAGQIQDSTHQTPADAEGDIVAQQAALEMVFKELKAQLQTWEDAHPASGKRNAAELEQPDLVHAAIQIMIRAAAPGTTLDDEVRREVDAIVARKKPRQDQGEGTAQQWGHQPPSPSSQDSMSESHRQLLATQFPSQSDSLSPPHVADYSRFTIKAPSSSFFPRIPTRRRGSQPSTAGTSPAGGNAPSTVVAPSPSLAGSSPTPAPTGPDNVLVTPAVIDVDSPDDTLSPSKQSLADLGSQPFADVPASPPQWTEGQAAQQEEGHPASPADSPLIEDISGSMFLTDAQQPSEPAIQIPLRLLAYESRAAGSADAAPDVSSASNAQLRILLEQAVAETQSRWAHSQNQAWALETSVERAWRQCRTAAEPVFGNIPEVPENSRVEEMARLCTRLAEETARWKNYYRDSTQETTALLANSVEEFKVADDRLREVEPAVAAYKGILDNWHTYCDQAYAEEQTGRAQVHQLRVRLQRATSAEQPQIQEQLEQQQQQISELTDRSAQWLLEGRKAQAELQHLVAKITSLQTQNQQLFDTVGLQLEHTVGEPFPTHVQHVKAVAAARVTVSEILGEWQAFQARLKISAPAILSACMRQATDQASQPSSSSHPAPQT